MKFFLLKNQMVTEVRNDQGKMIIRNSQKLCDFLKTDKMTWPGIKKHSNLPERCPFPRVMKKLINF